ncbi:MAG: mannosyltransferase B-like protein, partial [Candidatus Moranbacteria bacterium GW2011_GWD2_38_7]
MPNKLMKIGIDARFYGSIGKGLGRYTQKLIQHLEHIDKENHYVVFLRKENFDDYQPFNKNFEKVLADYAWYTFAEQLFFPLLLNKQKLDLMHFPHFNVPLLYSGRFVLTIHDLILTHFPTIRATMLNPVFYWFKYVAYKLAISSALWRAKKIIT